MKRFIVLTMMILLAALCVVTCLAADGTFYSVTLDSISDEYKTGGEFYVKVSLCDITAPNGFMGVGIEIEYDPAYLAVLEADDGGVVEAAIPEAWKDGGRIEIVETSEDGKQTGRIVLTYASPETESGSKDAALKTDDLYVIVKFRSLRSGKTAVKVNGTNSGNVCTGYDENGEKVSFTGKGSEMEFTFSENASAEESGTEAAEEKSYAPYYIIAAAAVAVAAAVLIISKFAKKK
ncbi:MAG: hypothetical protein IKX49_04190 [Clostridia bacterium]|nr:hypothetical protein [Clostridia bacterium]